MSLPQITFNSRNIAFPENVYKVQLNSPRGVLLTRGATMVANILNIAPDDLHAYGLRLQLNTAQPDFRRYINQWWDWATKGNVWYFAEDSSKTALTTLSSAAALGATSLTVTSITGISSGDILIIKNATDRTTVKVNGAPSGSAINLTEALDFAFTSGSRVRHERYWPGLILDTKTHPIVEVPPLHFGVEIVFAESMN